MRNLLLILLLGLFTLGCSSLTPLQRQEVRIAKYEAKLARIKADTLSIQRTDNTYRQTGWNLWWNDPFYFNRWGWNNQIYRPQIIIPLKRKRYGNRNINRNRSNNRSLNNNRNYSGNRNRQIRPSVNGNNTRNINPVRGSRGSSNSINRQPIRQKTKPQLPTRLRRGSTGGKKNGH